MTPALESAFQSPLALAAIAHGAALLWLVGLGLAGRRLLEGLGWLSGVESADRWLFAQAAGFSLATALLMGLAAAGLLNAAAVVLLLVAMVGLSWPAGRLLAGDVRLALGWLRGRHPTFWAAVALGLVVLAPFAVQTLLPNTDWDSALYHLPLAERQLGGALFGRDPYFPAFAFPGAVNLHYAALLALGLEPAIAPLNFWTMLLAFGATCRLAALLGGGRASAFAALAFATTPILWQQGTDPRIDGFLAFFVLLGFLALALLAKDRARGGPALALLGLSLGAALGCKYTALPLAACLLGAALLAGFRRAGRLSLPLPPARWLAVAVLALALPNGAWYAANTVLHGDPLFPILRGNYRLDGSGERVAVARAQDPVDGPRLRDPDVQRLGRELEAMPSADPPGHLFDAFDLFFEPDRYAVKPNHGASPLLLLSLVLPFLLPGAAGSGTRRAALTVWGAAWVATLLLASQTGLLRYVLPLLPPLAATAGLAIAGARARPVRAVLAALGVALLALDLRAELGKLELLRVAEAFEGGGPWSERGRDEWLAKVGYNFTLSMPVVTLAVNELVAAGEIGRDDVVWMVGEGKGRELDCRYVPDATWFAHRFLSALENASFDRGALARDLRAQGVTHVLYNRAYYDWVVEETQTDRLRVALARVEVERFLAEHGRTVLRGSGMQLVDIRTGARGVSEDPR